MVQKLKKIVKRKDYEMEIVGKVKSEGVEKGLVRVKVRNSSGSERLVFVTVSLDELLRVFS